MHTHMNTHMHMHVCVHMHVGMQVHMHMQVHVYVGMHASGKNEVVLFPTGHDSVHTAGGLGGGGLAVCTCGI